MHAWMVGLMVGWIKRWMVVWMESRVYGMDVNIEEWMVVIMVGILVSWMVSCVGLVGGSVEFV